MPCCKTNLKAAFVLGIIDLVLSCVHFAFAYFIFGEYTIGVVPSKVLIFGVKAPNASALLILMSPIVLIVGAKAPNASALLVSIILAYLKCFFTIGWTIYGFVVANAQINHDNWDWRPDWSLLIVGAIYSVLQVNLCQKLSFLNQLTHNMTRDCSLNPPKNTSSEHVQILL